MRPNIIRACALGIAIFTPALLLGLIGGIFGIQATENLGSTGINLLHITGVLNILLAYWIFEHRIP